MKRSIGRQETHATSWKSIRTVNLPPLYYYTTHTDRQKLQTNQAMYSVITSHSSNKSVTSVVF